MSRIALEKGITFNGKHSYDNYKMLLTGREIGMPDKKKIIATVPHSNREYDFSTIYGSQTYEQREVTYTFTLFNHHDIPGLEALRIICVNWLMGVSELSPLYDDEIKDYHFLGEVRNGIQLTFDVKSDSYELVVTFVCYPFKIANLPVGDDLWDPFCFDTDAFHESKYTMNQGDIITIINTGATPVTPTLICSRAMEITLNGDAFSLPAGTTQSDDIQFQVGENAIYYASSVSGTLEIVFHKEML